MSEGRVFVRGLVADTYDLDRHRRTRLDATRVRGDEVVVDDGQVGHSKRSPHSRTWWRLGPGDDTFLTQNLQVHFVEIAPGGSNAGHGHQNEAFLYILEGAGYEIHDDRRYDWSAGDLVIIHTDSVHRHFNSSATERALGLIIKAKSTWMFFDLLQQGRDHSEIDEDRFGPREEWSQLWTPGVEDRSKVVKAGDGEWKTTRDGKVRELTGGARPDVRAFSVDFYQQEIAPGDRSARHWHMCDEVLYVLSGSGYSLHWEVEAEIADRYYARIACTPSRHAFSAGDLVYVPQNTVHQHFNADTEEPLLLMSAQNRLIKQLGYDRVAYLEDVPDEGTPASV